MTNWLPTRILTQLITRFPIPRGITYRWTTRCTYCGATRRDPTDYCGRCGL